MDDSDADDHSLIDKVERLQEGTNDLVGIAEVVIHASHGDENSVAGERFQDWCHVAQRLLNRIRRAVPEYPEDEGSVTSKFDAEAHGEEALSFVQTLYFITTARATCLAVAAGILNLYRPHMEGGEDSRKHEYNSLGEAIQNTRITIRRQAREIATAVGSIAKIEEVFQASIGDDDGHSNSL
ncbi:hypothetical protein [Acidithiobacillus albertensis]|uniref:hypothetical protein n=1 Tax=Acidithiobacillus albertensis TaxID=119978 RepID=UPI001C06BCA8|nr:hypothetical protein [Acidithiobacillus albertensis]MBU2741554.1 hypothetical protein [Acidithiobacillus albertensis]